ncbi:MAG: hypothetical protein RL664_2051 [Bacteroidota bacterium]|jgi:hypothetical protein
MTKSRVAFLVALFFIVAATLSSCHLEKRVYSKGYHVTWNHESRFNHEAFSNKTIQNVTASETNTPIVIKSKLSESFQDTVSFEHNNHIQEHSTEKDSLVISEEDKQLIGRYNNTRQKMEKTLFIALGDAGAAIVFGIFKEKLTGDFGEKFKIFLSNTMVMLIPIIIMIESILLIILSARAIKLKNRGIDPFTMKTLPGELHVGSNVLLIILGIVSFIFWGLIGAVIFYFMNY